MGKRKDVGELKLTEKQERFCLEYIKDLNATRAGRAAGYSEKGLSVTASKLLTQANVQQRLSQLREKVAEKLELKAERVIEELAALGFWNIQDFIDEDNSVKQLHTVDRKLTRAVVGIKVTERMYGPPEAQIREVFTELKLVDKRASLVDLGRHLGIFEKDNRQKGEAAVTQFVTLSESLKKRDGKP